MYLIDPRTGIYIEKRVNKILKEMGIKEPPVDIDEVTQHLNIYKGFYDLEDPSLLQEINHKLKIGAKNFKDIFKKISLMGLCFPDENKILLDKDVPNSKVKYLTAHEVVHRILPTHNQLLLGDTAETIDPYYQEILEVEANYGASSMIFLNQIFTEEIKDYSPSIDNIKVLKSRYKNSLTSTFRRFIEVNEQFPIVGIISTPPWKLEPIEKRIRYFIKSKLFHEKFPGVTAKFLLEIVESYIKNKIGGKLGELLFPLKEETGKLQWFYWESFFNQHDILTLLRPEKNPKYF